jgi:hypothetical protein
LGRHGDVATAARRRILLIEDDEVDAFLVRDLLAAENARLEWALLPTPMTDDARLSVVTRCR